MRNFTRTAIFLIHDGEGQPISYGATQSLPRSANCREIQRHREDVKKEQIHEARVDDRKIVNAIFYVLRTGMPWWDLPVMQAGGWRSMNIIGRHVEEASVTQ